MEVLDRLVIRPELLAHIAEIDEFKGRWQALGRLAPERLASMGRIALVESVGASVRLEGVGLSDDEIGELFGRGERGGLGSGGLGSRGEQEARGYGGLLELVFESFAAMPLSESRVQQLHAALLEFFAEDAPPRSPYKTTFNRVQAFDAAGGSPGAVVTGVRATGAVLATASPFDTPRLMQELIDDTRVALDTRHHHPLLVIGAFVVRLLAIHPFQEGNGHLSRALTMLLLLRSGYHYVPYSSLDRVFEERGAAYRRALQRAHATVGGDGSGFAEWISFFVDSLLAQKNALARKIADEHRVAPLPPLSEQLLRVVREHGRITVRDGVLLTGANRNTVKDHLQRLVKSRQFAQRGKGRGTWYEKT